eukprot:TRINITY_DN8753_c0_g1_i1.p1 TRINITY_DN8753_c0_g1~~TRINITY_DN8753_c0_g1_i1.p1  ORF type:complete len:441 (+),score=93.21 TRINITY_DN8753_c0_g1_i1:12-1334(+)
MYKSLLILFIAIAFGLYYYQFSEDLSGSGMTDMPSLNNLNEIEKLRYSEEEFSFPRSKAIPEIIYDPKDPNFLQDLIVKQKPFLIKDHPVIEWDAMYKWNNKYFSYYYPSIWAHSPTSPTVRTHHPGQSFGEMEGVNWTKPFNRYKVSSKNFFEGKKLGYFMANAREMNKQLIADIYPLSHLHRSWRPPLEVNLWIGTPLVTTPLHFDMVHNFYTQIRGKKRWILVDPKHYYDCYPYTRHHPSARQSQVDLNDPQAEEKFPNFKNVTAYEVILESGDVLYIPPFYLHHVSAIGDDISLSISTHSDAEITHIRENIIELSLLIKFDEKWKIEHRINLAVSHVYGMFKSHREMVGVVNRLIESSYSHFDKDVGVSGLYEQILKSRQSFPSKKSLESMWDDKLFGDKYDYLYNMGKYVRKEIADNTNKNEKVTHWVVEIMNTE